jgi:regulatory protein
VPVVSSLTVQVKDPHRFNLFIDDEFYCGVDEQIVLDFKLRKGVEVTDADLQEIRRHAGINKMYMRVLEYVARRPRSEREVRDYLRKKLTNPKHKLAQDEEGNIEHTIELLISRLKSFNYLDDADFARWWIEQRTERHKPSGLQKIKSELFQKGISAEIIESAWRDIGSDEYTLAVTHYEKISNKYDINDYKSRKRLIDYMQRKGFRWATIQDVLKLHAAEGKPMYERSDTAR